LRGATPPIELQFIELSPGVLLEDDELLVSAFPVTHRGPGCFGFLFEEKSKRPFLAEEAERLVVPAGQERKRLVEGQAVTLADGTTVYPDQVLGPPRRGAKLAYVGDAAVVDDLVPYVWGADGMVIEATYLEAEQELAELYGHLTVGQAAGLAREAGVRTLYLNHISRRYSAQEVLQEAEGVFAGTIVARDFDRFEIRRGL
jgi:ribonuclease Z